MKHGSKLINKTTVGLIALIFILIFFSTTIYNFNLPKVTVAFPEQNEFILSSVTGIGAVELANKDYFFADISGIIEINLMPGAFCREGQLLYRIIPQNESLDSELAKLQNDYAAIENRIEKAGIDIDYYKQKLPNAEPEARDSYNKAISDLEYQLKALHIDKDNISIKIADTERLNIKALDVYARKDCVIENINAPNGSFIQKYGSVLTVGVMNELCVVNMRMSEDVSYLSPGLLVPINIRSKRLERIIGEIVNVSRENGSLFVEVWFPQITPPDDPRDLKDLRTLLDGVLLYGGETADIKVEFNSGLMEYVVPNSAVSRDSEGYYVYSVVRKQGAFGYDYIAQKKYVGIAQTSAYYTALNPVGFEFLDPIIINSDKVINNGDHVKLADGADYVEIR